MISHRLLLVSVVIFGSVLLGGCRKATSEEAARIRSPDGLVEAILTKGDFGATVDYVYKLYIVPTGAAIVPDQPILVADHVAGPSIVWEMPKFLTFSYSGARIFSFTNFWQSKDVQNFAYVVEIRLKPATDSYSLDKQ